MVELQARVGGQQLWVVRVLDFVACCLLLTHFGYLGGPVFLPAVESGNHVGSELPRGYLFWGFCGHPGVGEWVAAVRKVDLVR